MSAEMDLEAWLVEQDTVGAEGVDSSGCRANVCGITVASVGICFFFFKGYGDHRDLPSSPPRRSSDLHPMAWRSPLTVASPCGHFTHFRWSPGHAGRLAFAKKGLQRDRRFVMAQSIDLLRQTCHFA